MKKKGKKVPKNEDDTEEWCFLCKDGGDLIICEHKDCLKSYHPECVTFDDSSGKSKSRFICDLHKCEVCGRASDFQCYCCPKSVCGRCIRYADFVHVRGKKGFCDHCLKLTLLVEEKKDVDSDGETVDFNNRNTYETLYKEYWEIINGAEKLTLEDLLSAKTKLKSGKNYDSDKHDDSDEYQCSDSEEHEEKKPPHSSRKKLKRSKPEPLAKKVKKEVKGKSNKEEFDGWGSTRVIQFLTHIGKDTSIPLSQRELENIIKRYSMEKNLIIQKNKIVECDEWLRSVFKRKTIRMNRIYDSLETHLAENQVSSSSDDDEDEDEDEDEDVLGYELLEIGDEDKELVANKKKKKSNNNDDKAVEKKEDLTDVSHFQFAAIVPENVKLVYLKRSLVLKLMEEPESFESKVVGSFVRVKEDANGFSKGSYQLMQITGVTKCLAGENGQNFILRASETDICITSLSDDDFSEEECQDLKKKVKSGMLEKLELAVLEEKARSLHKDIVSHWIPRELGLLKHRIDQANEKGWRKELFEYLKRREFLLDETNKQKLLEKVPSLVPDVEDDSSKDSPKSILTHSSSAAFDITSEANKQEVPASDTYEMAIKLEKFFSSLGNQEKSRKSSVVKGASQLFDFSKEKSSIEDLCKGDVEDTESSQWFVTSPSGDRVGPVSLSVLKNWSQDQAASKSMIYKINETKEQAKPLTAVLNLAFSRK